MDQAERKAEPAPQDAARDLCAAPSKRRLPRLIARPVILTPLWSLSQPSPTALPCFSSKLALHTQNLAADGRASLMIDGTSPVGDPLAGGRVTLIGRAEITDSPTARPRYLARHPHAAMYADFPDFAFYRLTSSSARISSADLAASSIFLPPTFLWTLTGAEALVGAEGDIIAHMNEDHADAVRLYATTLLGARDGDWRMIGIDPYGADLMFDGDGTAPVVCKPHHDTGRSTQGARPSCGCCTRQTINASGLPVRTHLVSRRPA